MIIAQYLAVFSQNQVHFGRKGLLLEEKSISVCRTAVLPPGFPVMTRFTERLPIALIPEQFLVATVWDNVIHNRCFGVASLLSAFRTQRVALKERFACLLPSSAVAALCGRPCYLRVERFVFLAKLCSRLNQFRTAWVSTRNSWSPWHLLFLPRQEPFSEMTVGADRIVVHIQQMKVSYDAPGCQIVVLPDIGENEFRVLILRTEAVHRHRYRFHNADGVGQLNFRCRHRYHRPASGRSRHSRQTSLPPQTVRSG